MKAIIAVNKLGVIGNENKLVWESSDDLKHFKAMRQGRKMLVGYNTYQNLPPFLQKLCIVDQRDRLYQETTWKDHNDEEKLIEWLCIGGKKTYEKYCHLFTELHISEINDWSKGDCTYPDFTNLNTECKIFKYKFDVNPK